MQVSNEDRKAFEEVARRLWGVKRVVWASGAIPFGDPYPGNLGRELDAWMDGRHHRDQERKSDD